MRSAAMKENGFTLLEMSIVMLIIALIVGAVLSMQSLIRSSQLQTAIGEYDSYVKATKEFQEKFLALPGDMNNAESMWGTDPGGCPGAAGQNTVPTALTCNGDGNGTIGTSDLNGNLSNTQEWYRAWQQLYDSGFTGIELTGTPGPGGLQESRIGLNVPASALSGAGWTMLYYSLTTTNANLWGDQYGHVLMFGAYNAASLNTTQIISAQEAFAIDNKIDDGNPGQGIVRAWRRNLLPSCTANDTSQTNQSYAISNSSAQVCSLIFLMRM